MSLKIEKSKLKLVATYNSFFAPLGAIILLIVVWTGAVRESFGLISVLWAFFLTPALLWCANFFFEGFRLEIDTSQKLLTLHRWHRFQNKSNIFFEFSLSALEEFQVQRHHQSKRLMLKVNGEIIELTKSFDSTGRQEKLAEEIIGWLQPHGYHLKLKED